MKPLRYTLLSDGSTDQALLSILTWSLRTNGVACPIQSSWADLRRLPHPPRGLAQRVVEAVAYYPCDLLFVHRDAERVSYEQRHVEIRRALEVAATLQQLPSHVCVVPVRMQEAWLLFDETAIRWAAGNPNGQNALGLPVLTRLEDTPDPKETLYDLLREASGLSGRRRGRMNLSQLAVRVAEFVEDFAPLMALPAFRRLQSAVREAVDGMGWPRNPPARDSSDVRGGQE